MKMYKVSIQASKSVMCFLLLFYAQSTRTVITG